MARRDSCCRDRSQVVTAPAREAVIVSAQSAVPAPSWLPPLSSTRPAVSDAQVAASAHNAERRPKYRPRTMPGTRSPIQEVQALLPATLRAALVNAQPRKIACLELAGSGTKGRQASGRTHCREIPIVQSAALRLPNRRVHQAAGNWTS